MLNLSIAPLSNVDNLSTQKCLLPMHLFPQIGRPGQWMKCFFHAIEKETQKNFAVCQIFPRMGDHQLICYMDTSVSKFVPDSGDRLILDNVIPLAATVTDMTYVNAAFFLSPEHYTDNAECLSPLYLSALTQTLLQNFYFSAECSFKGTALKEKGVDYIFLRVADCEMDAKYAITDNTIIHIENVSLTPIEQLHKPLALDASPLKWAREQLDELINIQKIPGIYKNSLRLICNALLVGQVGCGKTTLIETFLSDNQCNVFRVTTSKVLKQYAGESEAELRKVFKAARQFEVSFDPKGSIVILLEDIHLLCPQIKGSSNNSETITNIMRTSAQLFSLVDELFDFKSKIICLATTSQPDAVNEWAKRPGRFGKEINITALSEEDRMKIFKDLLFQCLPCTNVSNSLVQMVAKQTQGYAIGDLALLAGITTKEALTKMCDSFECIVKECVSRSKPIAMRGVDITTFMTSENFSAIGGMFQLKKELEVSVLAGLKQADAFRRFGLTLPKGLLLYGPPGCAKTTVAKCLATEANMKFIATSSAEVYSPYVGCAEKFIAKLFNTARKNAPCLIFLDEIDSLVGRRALNSSSSNDVQTRILSTLLTEMDGIVHPSSNDFMNQPHILVVAATNRPDMIDDALMRPGRFDKLIHVPAPDLLSRRSILSLYQKRMPFSEDLDIDQIADRTENYSGADMCNLCNEAAIQAFQRDLKTNEIHYDDFDYVLKTSKSSLTPTQINGYYQFQKIFSR